VRSSVQSLEDIQFVPTKNILLTKIRFDDRNPNKLSNEKTDALQLTVEKYGFAVDPWVNDTGDGYYLVIDGEHRIKLLLEKGVKSVQCKIFKVKYVDVQMLRQVANKLRGQHDKTKDAEEFKSIFDNKKLDAFAKMLGEPIESFQEVLRRKYDISFGKEEGEIPEIPVEPKTKLGDIYQLGDHRVMCGDSNNSIQKLLGDEKFDLAVTSPPYDDLRTYRGYTFNFEKVIKQLFAVIKEGATVVWIVSDETKNGCESGTSFKQALKFMEIGFNLHDTMIWEKQTFTATGSLQVRYADVFDYMFIFTKGKIKTFNAIIDRLTKGKKKKQGTIRQRDGSMKRMSSVGKIYDNEFAQRFNIWKIITELSGSKIAHPAQFPEKLANDHIISWSNPRDLVLDPFLGSGSTLIACESTNRICYGMEIDPGYVDVIIQRWENFTGKKTKLIT